jgi:hypothetical protein
MKFWRETSGKDRGVGAGTHGERVKGGGETGRKKGREEEDEGQEAEIEWKDEQRIKRRIWKQWEI